MRLSVEVNVTDCRDCPFHGEVNDMGATINLCNHQEAPEGYDSVIPGYYARYPEMFEGIPKWCPLIKFGLKRK